MPLEQAQARKYQRVINTLGCVPATGCWKSAAAGADLPSMRRARASVHGLTISPSQLQVAQQRIAAPGCTSWRSWNCATTATSRAVRRRGVDRNVRGGRRALLAAVLRHRAARLKPGGKALVQSITIGERYFPRYRSSTDFIQQYIFPADAAQRGAL
jgi:cyclopropane-fatty-acyl-phospholipid synthase